MRKRTQARELALKALYQHDLCGELGAEALEALCEMDAVREALAFGRELIEGYLSNQEALDKIIEETAENWRLSRMPIIDRNILRLAAYEMLRCPDTPSKVIINEAIELAKKYSTGNSSTFVNGVLDRICSQYRPGEREGGNEGPGEAQHDCSSARAGQGGFPPDPDARADLHVHSSASDGSLAPHDLVQLAARMSLSAIALTDHDCVDGVAAAGEAASQVGVRVVPGVELSTYASVAENKAGDSLEVHILGLFVDPTDGRFLAELDRLKRQRIERIERISSKLRDLGLPFDGREVPAGTRVGSVGRVHVAREMVKQGICGSIGEAFDLYLGNQRPAYVPKPKLTPAQAIDMVHGAGGCAVLAHPGLTEGVTDILESLVQAGLDAIEVYCPAHTEQDESLFLDAARRWNLAVSGGSDFHGEAKPEVECGQQCVSFVEVCELADRAGRRRKAFDVSAVPGAGVTPA